MPLIVSMHVSVLTVVAVAIYQGFYGKIVVMLPILFATHSQFKLKFPRPDVLLEAEPLRWA